MEAVYRHDVSCVADFGNYFNVGGSFGPHPRAYVPCLSYSLGLLKDVAIDGSMSCALAGF